MDNISFTDYDLDFGDIGGTVFWDKPLDESKARGLLVGKHEWVGRKTMWRDVPRCISKMDGFSTLRKT